MSGTSVEVLETKITGMSEDIAHIRKAVDALTRGFAKLSVIEERGRSDREAIDRAFKEIERLDGEVGALERRRVADRDRANKWFYGATGVAAAIMAVWAVLKLVIPLAAKGAA